MKHRFKAVRNALAAAAVAASLLTINPAAALAEPGADPATASDATKSLAEITGLPTTVTTLADGVVLEAVDPEAAAAYEAQLAPDSYPCNSACDDKSPYYIWHPPGGPSEYFSCVEGSYPKYSLFSGNDRVYLQYSPRCRSVWARGPHAYNFVVRSWDGSSLRKQRYTESVSSSGDMSYVYTVMLNDKNLKADVCSGGASGPVTSHCTAKF
ncbi:DUF2690 domain-containing protein [Actinoplanes sp. NPDC049316]|uniref:DUF2690 domain-containing protein n=1 Tax=Actinoplanes sp. NPDC049316 TaxID=3154727 RepID=UPI0034144438